MRNDKIRKKKFKKEKENGPSWLTGTMTSPAAAAAAAVVRVTVGCLEE